MKLYLLWQILQMPALALAAFICICAIVGWLDRGK
jgi:hypothetical protein